MSLFDNDPREASASAPEDLSPVLGRLAQGPTLVARRDSPFGMIAGLAGVGALGFFVFTSLSHARHGAMAQTVKPAYAAQMAAQAAALAAARAAGQAAAQASATPPPAQPMVQPAARTNQSAYASTGRSLS